MKPLDAFFSRLWAVRLVFGLIAVGLTLAIIPEAFAQIQPGEGRILPWGDLTTRLINGTQEGLLALFMLAANAMLIYFVPAWLQPFVMTRRTDQLLRNAALSAIARTKGAVAGKQVTVPVMNEMLGRAMQYGVDQAPSVVDWAAANMSQYAKILMARFADQGVVPAAYGSADAKKVAAGFDAQIKKGMGQ
jgi:hypothetical protein